MDYVYIVQCRDKTLYTGYTKNLKKRIQAHNAGKGAKYTRGRGPVALVYWEECKNKSLALSREAAIKKLPRDKKLELVESKIEKVNELLQG